MKQEVRCQATEKSTPERWRTSEVSPATALVYCGERCQTVLQGRGHRRSPAFSRLEGVQLGVREAKADGVCRAESWRGEGYTQFFLRFVEEPPMYCAEYWWSWPGVAENHLKVKRGQCPKFTRGWEYALFPTARVKIFLIHRHQLEHKEVPCVRSGGR